ncbi:MAG: hypothetical protein V3U03_04195 [Myxococcota bacterium]
MESDRWRLFYQSDLQGVYSLLVVPGLFLVYLLLSRRSRQTAAADPEARFVRLYALVFCVQTLLDPLCTGPLVVALDLGYNATSALMVCLVLLGDFRVFLLIFALADRERRVGRALGEAALWTLVVPVTAYASNAALEWFRPDLGAQRLWLLYELGFLAIALVLRHRVIPRRLPAERADLRRALRGLAAYVAGYYALWAVSDTLILFWKVDFGWLLRIVPNQLYYAFWVPVAYFALFPRTQGVPSVRAPGR